MNEVARVVAARLRTPAMTHDQTAAYVLASIRSALRDGRLSPDQVGAAVGLRAIDDADRTPILAVAPEVA